MKNKTKWIWQQNDYPDFHYNKDELEPILLDIKYYQGVLNGIKESISENDFSKVSLEIFEDEAIYTSAIEGEILNRDSVRSSLAKKLGMATSLKDSSNRQTDGLIDLLIDATYNYDKPFTLERLFGWHNALFASGYGNSFYKINIASFRGEEEMQIVSGVIGKEKVHYVAPPRKDLEHHMEKFLLWINDDKDLSIIKAAIAHLWFVIIHPMDDGNGRIARALTDMILSREAKSNIKLYSFSNAIQNDKKGYYNSLEMTTSGDIEITFWLKWFLNTLLQSLKDTKYKFEVVLTKARFWEKHREAELNQRQIKVLNKLLDKGDENFIGGINTRKYAAMTKTSKPTAARELKSLVDKNILIQIENSAGRNIAYKINYN